MGVHAAKRVVAEAPEVNPMGAGVLKLLTHHRRGVAIAGNGRAVDLHV